FSGFAALLAVSTRSTAACVVGSLLFWLLCWAMNFGRHALASLRLEEATAAFGRTVDLGYWLLPKPADFSLILHTALAAAGLRLAEGPMDFLLREAPPLLWHVRERLAAFVGTAPERLVFTANVTAAVNVVASGLRLTAPGEILMSDREYGAMQWCWERAARC